MHIIRSCTTMAFALWSCTTCAQKYKVHFTADAELPERWLRAVEVGAKEQVPAALTQQLALLHGRGYLEASIDSCKVDSTGTTCPIHVGRVYEWVKLSGSGIPGEIASEARFREKLYTGKPIDPKGVQRLFEDLLAQCENNGFPFARVKLDSLRFKDDGLAARVLLEKGRLVKIDSVLVRGTAKTNPRYLQSLIGVKPGDLYNETLVRSVEKRVREMPFVQQKQRAYVQFTPDKTKLFLFLEAKKASSINGILGVQPDPSTGKVKLTGDL
ncbi:MAG TPA: hypothetical protein PK760_07620, partial [Flavobacteriales bacterium]|nr:hypothetical protein [Flavobacteriales bacterium]